MKKKLLIPIIVISSLVCIGYAINSHIKTVAKRDILTAQMNYYRDKAKTIMDKQKCKIQTIQLAAALSVAQYNLKRRSAFRDVIGSTAKIDNYLEQMPRCPRDGKYSIVWIGDDPVVECSCGINSSEDGPDYFSEKYNNELENCRMMVGKIQIEILKL